MSAMVGMKFGVSMPNWLNLVTDQDKGLEEVIKLGSRGCYDFVSRNSKKLLVTIGDSWTYGYRLAEEDLADPHFRSSNTFGYLISNEFNADFLNISVPAINNLWMIKKLEAVCKNVEDYNQVDVIVMATELGREFNTDFDMDPVYTQLYKDCWTAKDVIVALSDHVSNRIESCRNEKIKIHTFTNYVTNLYKKGSTDNWLEILCDTKVSECYAIGSWVIPKFEHLVDYNQAIDPTDLKTELLTMMELAEKRFKLIYNTGYNHKAGYGHPNSKGHLKFAEYFINQYRSKYA